MIPVPHTQPFFHSMTQIQPFTLSVPQPWPSMLSVPKTQPCSPPPQITLTPHHPQAPPCPPTPPNSAEVPLITSVPESPSTPTLKLSLSASHACPSSSPTPQHPLSSFLTAVPKALRAGGGGDSQPQDAAVPAPLAPVGFGAAHHPASPHGR